MKTSDDFEKHAMEILGHSPDLLGRLLRLRREALKDEVPDNFSAAEINSRNQAWIDKAADLLGADNFEAIFGHSPSERVNLVDPALLHSDSSTAKATKRPASPAPMVTLKHLSAALAEQHEMSKKAAETVLNDLVGNIVKHLKRGQRIRIGGLGILQVRKRVARLGRNPATGQMLQIKASKKVAFRTAKELTETLDGHRRKRSHPLHTLSESRQQKVR